MQPARQPASLPTETQKETRLKFLCQRKVSPELFLLLLRENVRPNAVQLQELSEVGFVGVQLVLYLLHPLLQSTLLPTSHCSAVANHRLRDRQKQVILFLPVTVPLWPITG